jgi:hypothetical protein
VRALSEAYRAGAGTPFEWWPTLGYDRQPYASVVAGPWALAAGPNGVQIGVFGWADPKTGAVSNTRIAGGQFGFVLPVIGMYNWQRVFPQAPATGCGPAALMLRAGMQCVLAAAGDFLTRFALGAQAGQQVFADPVTGAAYGGNPGGAVATPWTVMQNACGCNALLRISSFAKPFN